MTVTSSLFLGILLVGGLIIISRRFPDPATAGADIQEQLFGSRNFFGELFGGVGDFFGLGKTEDETNREQSQNATNPVNIESVVNTANAGNDIAKSVIDRNLGVLKAPEISLRTIENQTISKFPKNAEVLIFEDGTISSTKPPLLVLTPEERASALQRFNENRKRTQNTKALNALSRSKNVRSRIRNG